MDKINKLKKMGMIIKLARIKKEISQGELARRAGVAQSALSDWERGEKCPNMLAAKAIEKILEVKL